MKKIYSLCLTKSSRAYWRNWRAHYAACTWSREEDDNASLIVVMTVKMELVEEYDYLWRFIFRETGTVSLK